jgi:hypothetical protein
MNRYLSLGLLICAIMLFAVTGCENASPELLGTTLAGIAQTLNTMSADAEGFNGNQNNVQSFSMSAMGASVAVSTTPTIGTDGWVTLSRSAMGTTVEVKFSFWTAGNSVLTAPTLAELYTLADTSAKTLRLNKNINSTVYGTFASTLTYTRDMMGSRNGAIDGECTGTGPNGGTVSGTFTGIRGKGDGSRTCIGGSLSVVFTSPRGKTWELSLTFNSQGQADGAIVGPNYNGTLHLEPNNTGYLTDSGGQHDLTAPSM